MSETLIQAAIWLGAGGTLFIFLKRRRSSRRIPVIHRRQGPRATLPEDSEAGPSANDMP